MARRTWIVAVGILAWLAMAPIAPVRGQQPAPPDSALDLASALERTMTEVVARAEKSVVAIARVKDNSSEALNREARPDPFGQRLTPPVVPSPTDPDFVPNDYATGVVVDRRGLILTTYQTLGENSTYYVTTHDHKTYRASIKGADPRSDLAVLAIDAADLTPIVFGDAAGLRKGKIVMALGNPFAIARDGQVSASWGIVANLARKAPMPDEADSAGRSTKTMLHHFGTLIQTDVRLNSGTSGGPLLNLRGEMIGLITSLPPVAGYEQAAGYAYPVDQTFRRAVELLKQGREVEYGFLGIAPESPTPDELLKGVQGARVRSLNVGTPAHRYGLKPNDLITSVNGIPIHDADGLVLEVGRLPVESVVRLGVVRDRDRLDVDVTLSKYPVRGRKIITTPAPSWRGMRIDYPTAVPENAERPVAESSAFGRSVVVTEVEQGTPAWRAGLRPGMLISKVDQMLVRTPREFQTAVAGKSGPIQVVLAGGQGESPVRTVPPG